MPFYNTHEELFQNSGILTFGEHPDIIQHDSALLAKWEEFDIFEPPHQQSKLPNNEIEIKLQEVEKINSSIRSLYHVLYKKPTR